MEVHGNEYHEPDFSPVGHTHTESEITDLDHDAQKIKGKAVDDSAIGDGKVLVYRTAGDKLQYEAQAGGGGPHASSHETGGGDLVHFADLEHDETDPTLHDALTSTPHISQADKDKIHDRLHALSSALDHSGQITDVQHGTKTTIPNAHHVKTGDDEVYGLIRTGLDANKPAAGVAGRFYWATDTKILYRDTGTAWEETARGETVTRLAQLSEKAHSSLTGIGASDHHTKTVSSEIDHGSVMGLGDDDHSQYLNVTRHDLTGRHPLGTVVPHDALASLTERDHANLTNVTAYQHHAWQQRLVLVKMIGHASKSGTGWAVISYSDVVFDPNWLAGTVKGRLCIVARMTGAGTGYARLYQQFQGVYMASTQIDVTGTGWAIYRSPEFSDWYNGLESYQLALYGASGVSIEVASAFMEVWVS